MTIDALTMMVVDVLGKYVIDNGTMLVKEVGENAAQYATQLCELVLKRLNADPVDARNAERFKNDPEGYQVPMADAIAKKMESDPNFATQLSALLDEYKKITAVKNSAKTEIRSGTAAMQGGIAAGEGGVAVSGNVTGGINIRNTQSSRSAGGGSP